MVLKQHMKWIVALALVLYVGSAARSMANGKEPVRTIFGTEIHYEAVHDENRKLGRGWANVLFGFIEFPQAIVEIKRSHGSIASLTWGVIEGWDRWMQRERKGVAEIKSYKTANTDFIIEPEFIQQPNYDNSWRIRHIQESF